MSFGGMIRRFGYRVRDWMKNAPGERIHEQWADIQKTMSNFNDGWPRVEASLAACLKYATEKSPFYKDYIGQSLSSFPVMNKLSLLENYAQIRSVEFKDSECHKSRTSGSTGTIFVALQNKAKRNRVLAELQWWGECVGYRSHEKMIFFRALHKVPFWSMFFSNVWQYDIALMDDAKLNYLFKLQKASPHALIAYASTFDVLTSKWLEQGKCGYPSVKAVFSGSEFLTQSTRERIEKFWPNATAYSRYSNMENGIIAQETGEPDSFGICWASYYVEVLKLTSDEPAAEGELGRIVITDMYNRAFPMIRYDTGDAGCLVTSPDGWKYLKNITGRRVDFIYNTKGEVCSPHLITNALWGVKGGILQFQFIQIGEKDYLLKFIAKDEEIAIQQLKEKKQLKLYLGEDANIQFVHVDEIPVLASGKRKMIVQAWKINHSQTK